MAALKCDCCAEIVYAASPDYSRVARFVERRDGPIGLSALWTDEPRATRPAQKTAAMYP